jgi:hypothetical protein
VTLGRISSECFGFLANSYCADCSIFINRHIIEALAVVAKLTGRLNSLLTKLVWSMCCADNRTGTSCSSRPNPTPDESVRRLQGPSGSPGSHISQPFFSFARKLNSAHFLPLISRQLIVSHLNILCNNVTRKRRHCCLIQPRAGSHRATSYCYTSLTVVAENVGSC